MPEYPRSPFEKTGTSITPKVDGDALDATVIGGTTPAVGTFTDIEANSSITLSGNGHLVLPSVNDAVTPTIALGDGDTGFYEEADDQIMISLGGAKYWDILNSMMGAKVAGGGVLVYSGASATSPFVRDRGDADTGIGSAAANQLSLIAGAIEGIRVGVKHVTTMVGQIVHKTDAGAADYNPSALTSDYIITVDTTSAARAVTISTEDRDSGTAANPRIFIIKDLAGNAGTHNITVSLETSGNIDGAATHTINGNYDSITLMIDGTNGHVI